MAQLFDKDETNIRKHINNVFSEGELLRENNTQYLRVDGVKQPVAFYNLDVIISVGYRVRSIRGTQFRIWATARLKEYIAMKLTERRKRNKCSLNPKRFFLFPGNYQSFFFCGVLSKSACAIIRHSISESPWHEGVV